MTDFPNFNEPFVQIHNNKLNLSAQFNPLKHLTIDLNAERSYSNNLSENYRIEDQRYVSLNTNEYGNFGMSTILIKTAFSGGSGIVNNNFQKFRDNRLVIAQRLARIKPVGGIIVNDKDGFPEGYNKNHQTVMIASFWPLILGQTQIKSP